MKFAKFLLILVLFQSSTAVSSTSYSYASATNPMAEMFLIMMDMFGMVEYNRGYTNSPYSNAVPFNYGVMTGMAPGLSQMSSLSALNPMPGLPMANNSLSALSSASSSPLNSNFLANQHIKALSPLEGVWLGSNGDILVFMGDKFFYSTQSAKKLTGTARIVDNKIIADIDDSEKIIKFFYELKGGYLAVRVTKEILYFKKQI